MPERAFNRGNVMTWIPATVFASEVEDVAKNDIIETIEVGDAVFVKTDEQNVDASINVSVAEDLEPTTITALATETDYIFTNMTGSVEDTDGIGISGVSVLMLNLNDPNENNPLHLYQTDINGRWSSASLDAVVGHTYLISFYKQGYEFENNDLRVVAVSGGTTVETVTATEIGELICDPADYTYTADSTAKTSTITGYTGSDTAIALPAELGGYPVTSIAYNTFAKKATL